MLQFPDPDDPDEQICACGGLAPRASSVPQELNEILSLPVFSQQMFIPCLFSQQTQATSLEDNQQLWATPASGLLYTRGAAQS